MIELENDPSSEQVFEPRNTPVKTLVIVSICSNSLRQLHLKLETRMPAYQTPQDWIYNQYFRSTER